MSELQYGLDEVLPAGPGDHTNAHDTHYGRQRRALYRLLQPIGNGTQSTIRLAQFLPTGEFFAVKAYSRSPRNSPIDPTVPSVETLVSRKLRIFGLVSQNPHVVKFYEHFATEQKHYFVFELCKGKVSLNIRAYSEAESSVPTVVTCGAPRLGTTIPTF